jgi:hypothetical protein
MGRDSERWPKTSVFAIVFDFIPILFESPVLVKIRTVVDVVAFQTLVLGPI